MDVYSMSGHLGGPAPQFPSPLVPFPHTPRMYYTVHVDVAIFILYVWCTHRNSKTQLYSRREGGGAHASAPILVCTGNRQPRCAFDAGRGDGARRVDDPQSLPFAVRGPWPLTIPFAARQGAPFRFPAGDPQRMPPPHLPPGPPRRPFPWRQQWLQHSRSAGRPRPPCKSQWA